VADRDTDYGDHRYRPLLVVLRSNDLRIFANIAATYEVLLSLMPYFFLLGYCILGLQTNSCVGPYIASNQFAVKHAP
jgi:hypothetical protein